jgi:hypothetical protein
VVFGWRNGIKFITTQPENQRKSRFNEPVPGFADQAAGRILWVFLFLRRITCNLTSSMRPTFGRVAALFF